MKKSSVTNRKKPIRKCLKEIISEIGYEKNLQEEEISQNITKISPK